MAPDPVTADDVDTVLEAAVAALWSQRVADWGATAGPLDWTCWETVEHVADGLFYYATQLVPVRAELAGGYPYDYRGVRPGGPEGIVFVRADQGVAGLLRALNSSGGLLASIVRTAPPSTRAYHMWGHSDPEGFAAMGVVEVLVHLHDMAGALGLEWAPDPGVCHRVVTRLFPHAPAGDDPAATLLWATGRVALPGHPRLVDWRWYAEPAGNYS